MADIIIPLETPYDMMARLMLDDWFLTIFFVGTLLISYLVRRWRLGTLQRLKASVMADVNKTVRTLKKNNKGFAPLAFLGALVGTVIVDAVFNWILGSNYPDGATYVEGWDFATFMGEMWPIVTVMTIWLIVCTYLAFPSKKAVAKAIGGRL